jgi:hypothetical protein
MASVTLNGVTYTDDTNAVTGLANGGHRVRFIPALSNFLSEAANQIALAAAQATQATVNGAAQVTLATTQAVNSASSAIASANSASDSANSASASAASAIDSANAPTATGTSADSLTIGAGAVSLTTQTGKAFITGQWVVIASTANPTNYMLGKVTGYVTGTGSMTVSVSTVVGSGTFAAWSISVTAANFNAQAIATAVAADTSVITNFFLS